jgi:formylglycine-generating enzyme required for sulfatase activity
VWDAEGEWVASGGASKIKLWDLKTGNELATIDFLAGCLAQSPDGRRIAAASMDPDPNVMLWDVDTKQRVLALRGTKEVAFVDFSPDGTRLATVGRWNVQIWDTTTGRQLLELGEPKADDPNEKVFSTGVRFSPDGLRVASVRGELLRIWSIGESLSAPRTGLASTRAPDVTNQKARANLKQNGEFAETAATPDLLTTKVAQVKLKRIPAGTFLMGAPANDSQARDDETPQHRVTITRAFYLGVHEVTQSQYDAVMGNNPSWFSASGPGHSSVAGRSTERYPVENVSWLDAVKFCNALSEKEGRTPFYEIDEATARAPDWKRSGFRLPTEAEWEYACRANAPSVTRFSFGDDVASLGKYAWYMSRSTHSGGMKRPNGFGLFDMHGNVWEWCWDLYDGEYYKKSPQADPRGGEAGTARVFRGGCWYDPAARAFSAYRWSDADGYRNNGVGFRLAVDAGGS